MGSGVPLLNEYKREFFWKRFPQTVLGGPRLRLGYRAPAYVYIGQILVFLLPWVIGGVFTALVQMDILTFDVAACCSGALTLLFVLALQITSSVKKRKKSSVFPAGAGKNTNLLSEEDEVDFDGCCVTETFNFIVPPKKFIANIVLHSVLSGFLVGTATWYLLPRTLDVLYGASVPATVLVFMFGWFAVCIAQYSLTTGAPPETAIYRSSDTYETLALTRPFYVCLCFSFHIVNHFEAGFLLLNQTFHVVLTLLPVLWTLGMAAPIDALCLWVLEQALVLLFGGSPMASDLGLFVMFLLSTGSFILAYFIPAGCQTPVVMAMCGYLLSTDLGGLGAQIVEKCRRSEPENRSEFWNLRDFLWRWSARELGFHLAMVIVAGGCAAVVCWFIDLPSLSDYLGYVIIGLLVLQVLLAELQSVYVCGGLCRNSAFPVSVESSPAFLKRKKRLNVLGYFRRAIVDFVAPLLMLLYLTLVFDFSSTSAASSSVFNTTIPVLNILGAHRAFRWVWQSSQDSLLELSILHILRLALPSDNPTWPPLGVGLQLLILSVTRDRLSLILGKLWFWVSLTVKSWTDDRKQRRSSLPAIIALNVVLSPLVVVAIVSSAALASPLLPLFTLPLFLVGFPRPTRFWPGEAGASESLCPDTVFYRQAAPQLARIFREGFASGTLGWPSPGRHYLVRFQDRLVWVQVLERGYVYCRLSIKGLELQETSCHTAEATRVDDIIEETFESKSRCGCHCNNYLLHSVKLCDAMHIRAYSDAKNQLTGVIDSPETLQLIKSSFPSVLLWVLLRHMRHQNGSDTTEGNHSTSVRGASPVKQGPRRGEDLSPKAALSESKEDNDLKAPTSTASRASLNSYPNSIWSDDNDSLLDGTSSGKKGKVSLLISGKTQVYEDNSPFDLPPVQQKAQLTGNVKKQDDIDDLFNQLDFGLPATDVGQRDQTTNVQPTYARNHGNNNNSAATTSAFRTTSSKHSKYLILPEKWLSSPVESSKISRLSERFDVEWFKYIVIHHLDSEQTVAKEISDDNGLIDMYRNIVLTCFAIIYDMGIPGGDAVSAGPSFVHKLYKGEVPWSLASDWLTEDAQLLALIVKGFRYTVKLSLDQVLLGEASDSAELAEYLADYDQNWVISTETDPNWAKAISMVTPQLFSLDHDTTKSVYTSRVLTCQEVPAYVTSLSSEAVRGLWADLSLELLYMTNDDEERYSIQAHSALLRNLSVQAADPPLGYPIYSSRAVSVPTL